MLQAMRRKTDWLTRERRAWLVAVFVAGCFGFGLGNGHTTDGAIRHISIQLGDAKKDKAAAVATAGCEHWRAAVSTQIADQAIVAASTAMVPVPSFMALPSDCPHPKK